MYVVKALHVMVGKTVHIKLSEMKWTKAVVDSQGRELSGTSPNEQQLVKEQCDLTETLLEDATTMVRVPLHNWRTNPIYSEERNSFW